MPATAVVIDLSDVKEGGNFRPKRKPEGDYRAKLVSVADHQPNDKTKPKGWVYTVQIEGDARSTYPYYVNPAKNQLWKIAGLCRAVGIKVKMSKIKFDPNKLVGRELGVALADDEYEGRAKSVIDDVFSVDEIGSNADEDAPEGDEVDVDDDEIVDEEEPEEDEEPEPAPKRRRKAAPEPEPDEEEEEEEEEEPAPAPKRRAKAPAKKAAPKKAAAPVEDDEDEEDLDIDELDD
jgi:hypothetical protein